MSRPRRKRGGYADATRAGFEVDERRRIRLLVDSPLGDQPEMNDLWIGPVAGPMTAAELHALLDNRQLLGVLAAAESAALTLPPDRRAQVHRLIGEDHERLGRLDDAIKHYELALASDPTIRLKKRLLSLKRKLARSHSPTLPQDPMTKVDSASSNSPPPTVACVDILARASNRKEDSK